MASSKGGGGGGGPKRRSIALSDQWMDFAERTFDADDYSEGFFLTHSEAEADERCAELMVGRSVYHTMHTFSMRHLIGGGVVIIYRIYGIRLKTSYVKRYHLIIKCL